MQLESGPGVAKPHRELCLSQPKNKEEELILHGALLRLIAVLMTEGARTHGWFLLQKELKNPWHFTVLGGAMSHWCFIVQGGTRIH